MNYESLESLITKARSHEPKIGYETRAVFGADERGYIYTAIRYHKTEVVRFYANGETRFDSGGWLTKTTKDRMNLADGFSIWQKNGHWFIRHNHHNARTYRFTDGITFTKRGRAMNAPDPAKVAKRMKQEERLRKQIRRFANDAAEALAEEPRPAHNLGDCWYCGLRTTSEETGRTLGDATNDHDHLTEHMADHYYPSALFVNAMEETKQHPAGVSYDLAATQDDAGEWLIGGPRTMVDNVAEGIYRYMVRRLIPNRVLPGGTRPTGTTYTDGMATRHA